MPQFDQSSFFNQVFWLFFFLSDFYLLITYLLLPAICEVLKFRKKKVYQNIKDLNILSLEHNSQNIENVKISQQNFIYYDEILKKVSTETFNLVNSVKSDLLLNLNIQNYLLNFWINFVNYPKNFN